MGINQYYKVDILTLSREYVQKILEPFLASINGNCTVSNQDYKIDTLTLSNEYVQADLEPFRIHAGKHYLVEG